VHGYAAAVPGRVVIYSMVLPATVGLEAIARAEGYEPVALITPKLRDDADEGSKERFHDLVNGAPAGLDVCIADSKDRLERLTRAYEPRLGLCIGYRWRLPPEVLAIPELGVVNGHPSMLPRHRGPYPFAWAVREQDAELGMTYHLMDEDFDTGPILAQDSRPMPDEVSFPTLQPLLASLSLELLPRALARLEAGDRGDPQAENGATYAGPFGEDYQRLDWSLPAADVHRQVAAWQFMQGLPGPLAEFDGETMRVVRTSLTDPGEGARRVEAGDGPIWVLETEAVRPKV
jgi:methionyl-tRNA formyltransferase